MRAAERYAQVLFADDPVGLKAEINDLARSIEGAWARCGGDAARDEENLDVSMARLISGNFGDPWRYIPELGKWVEWNNVNWEFVDPLAIEQIIQQFNETLLEDALRENDRDRRMKLMSMANSLCKSFKVSSVAKAMMREYQESIEVLDQNVDLVTFPDSKELKVSAKTYNVATGELKDPDPEDYITMTLGAPYMPGHRHPANDQYWVSSFPDRQTREQTQEHLSLGLLAKIVQERIYSCYGKRASGKGTLLFAATAALGDYGLVGSNSTINGAGGFDGSSKDFDLIHFRGKRLIYFDEFIGRLSEKAKTLSQAGEILAHVKNGDAVEVNITCTLWISTNERPRIDPTDSGLHRRLVEIPMNAGSDTPLDPDWHIKDTLIHDESARAAFLWTLIEALERARTEDFRPPLSAEMREATDEWIESADLIGDWWAECIEKTDDPRDIVEHAYTEYTDWMDAEHGYSSYKTHPRASHKQFAAMMKARGVEVKRTNKGTAYVGVRIRTVPDPAEALTMIKLPPIPE